ncbi:MAG: T9SS-dependent M36 family metallopeptidase [Bacteroidota bacterium]
MSHCFLPGRPALAVLLSVLICAPTLFAQAPTRSAAAEAALTHFRAQHATYRLAEADVEAMVTDEYRTPHLGVTHVYLRQTHAGLEILEATANANVRDNGSVSSLRSQFVPNLANLRTAEARPSLDAIEAIAAAAAALELPGAATGFAIQESPEGVAQRQVLDGGQLSLEPIPARLAWVQDDLGALRLVWSIAIATLDAQHWWDLAVDAHTGQILRQHDWVVSETWTVNDHAAHSHAGHSHAGHNHAGHHHAGHASHALARSFAPTQSALPALAPAPSNGGTYRVVAFPAESPIHGPIVTVTDPADPVASPNGWHNDGSQSYTITRGNNVFAYEDRGDRNFAGYSPDGGADLVFDFPFADDNDPVAHEDFAITNLFYWNNIFHDVMVAYGFDEASGNFQQTNFSGEGRGGDYVRAEAQDGSGTNNANFGTPPDGSRPRMQMYLWTAALFNITAPANVAATYPSGPASFGPPFPSESTTGVVVLGEDDEFSSLGCTSLINGDLSGQIVMLERGSCNFVDKVRNAQAAGAAAAIIFNCEPGADGCSTNNPGEGIISMGLPAGDNDSDITIPSVFVQRSTGLLILDNDPAEVALTGAARDSDLDNGIILHEYTHGVSNRLTGGPANASCLTNAEQAGEGWSDYYGLMFTMTAEDVATEGRGIGTYVEFTGTDGPGIRPARYSTDLSVNPLTYADVADTGRISQPHGIGTVWATMLWEMTWNLIDRYGYDPDLTNGTGGNNIAMQLVTDGMKLQRCNPGFVDGRDAILEADELANGGVNQDLIWAAFAKRGLGFNADQGNPDSRTDGVEDFTLPPPVASEGDEAFAGTHLLSAVYPNPFNPEATFTLQVATAQDVSVVVYDVLGRQVAALHDGALAAGALHRFEVDGRALASGAYVLRVQGEDFAETRRLTLVK